jgi:predicted DNA-binding antitoxin AbrB/MazE fold protein
MMNSTVMAIYENGVLRPLTPLALPEHARVQVHVRQTAASSDAAEHRRRVREALVASGLSLPSQPPPFGRSTGRGPGDRQSQLASVEQVRAALRYYAEYPDEIDLILA